MADIIPFPALQDNYIWLLKNNITRHVAIVDPGESNALLEYIQVEKLLPIAILITHHHWDHTNGIAHIVQHYNIPVYTPKYESVSGSTHPVAEGDNVPLPELGLNLTLLDVPGHTSGAIAYYADGFILSGDTLFTAGCGRVFEGTPLQMYTSLSKFKDLSDETLLYCGHEYTLANLKFADAVEPDNAAITTRHKQVKRKRECRQPTVPEMLGIEKKTNPFLRCDEPTVIAAAEQYAGEKLPDPAGVFHALRSWKNHFG